MVLVRLVFQVKWGQMDEVLRNYQQNAAVMRRLAGPNVKFRTLTDLSGPFFTLVQEFEVESLAAWEKHRLAMFSDPDLATLLPAENSPFVSGHTEFYTIEIM